MSTPLEIPVGTVVKAVKFESDEPEIVDIEFRGKHSPKSAGYQVLYQGHTFCAGYEFYLGTMMLAFTR